jgi:nucleoside-diphosphate-sugar epimerase
MSHFIVTGASGFIASSLIQWLRERGADTLGVARRDCGNGVHRVSDYSLTPTGRVLIHLAETADRGAAERAGARGEAESVGLFAELLMKPFEFVVYGSSAALYGDAATTPRRANDAVYATDAYSRIKQRCESLVLERGGCVARLSNVYGPGMHASSVLAGIVAQLPGAGPLSIGSRRPVRDFLWVADAAAGLNALGTKRRSGVYNLGTGVGTSIGALAEEALTVAGQADRAIVETAPQDRTSHLVLDCSTTEQAVGWKPLVPLRDGLRQLLMNPRPRDQR